MKKDWSMREGNRGRGMVAIGVTYEQTRGVNPVKGDGWISFFAESDRAMESRKT